MSRNINMLISLLSPNMHVCILCMLPELMLFPPPSIKHNILTVTQTSYLLTWSSHNIEESAHCNNMRNSREGIHLSIIHL